MQSKVIWSFLSVVALSAGALVSACDSDATIAKSGVGESCDSAADCEDGLNCIQGACYKGSPDPGGGEGGSDDPGVGPLPPVLGGEGESCTKRADCEENLGCFNQRCTAAATGEGGGGPGGPSLGGPGETCGLTSDCGEGLACLPQGGFVDIKAAGSNSIGVCTPLDSGLEPSGNTCGKECLEAADCCELPVEQHTPTGAASCTELALLVADIPNCDTATGQNGIICLAYNVYCDEQCGASTWACNEAGRCEYTASCTKEAEVVGGCPTYTRAGFIVPECNPTKKKCEGTPLASTGCKNDAACDAGLAVADYPADVCVEGECACIVAAGEGKCYRKCAEDLDCPTNYRCDMEETSLCVPEDTCTTDAFCVTAYGDIRAKCVAGQCSVPCEHDIDCNEGGLVNGAFSRVCAADNTCQPLGCSSNDECGIVDGSGSQVRSFCGPTPAPATGATAVVSAITD